MTGSGARQVSDVRDVLVYVTARRVSLTRSSDPSADRAPDPTPVSLAGDLRIETLRDEEADAVMDACRLPGVEFKAYGQLSFARTGTPAFA
jgi:hypothetical protein